MHIRYRVSYAYPYYVRISDCFDMLCGTSTGGIIALAASLKKPMRDVVTFYEQDGPIIFNEKLKKAVANATST